MTYNVLSWIFAGAWAVASACVLALIFWDEWAELKRWLAARRSRRINGR